MEFNKKLTLVVDVDELLLYISPFWTYMLHKNGDYFEKYLNLNRNYKKEEDYYVILFRDTFDIGKFLENDYAKSLGEESEEYQEYRRRYFSIQAHPDFYKYAVRSRMSYAIEDLSKSDYCKEIYIITRHPEEANKSYKGKEKAILDIFSDDVSKKKLKDIVKIPIGKSKGELLRNIQDTVGYDVFYDDELGNVFDVMDKKDMDMPIDIYIPKMGYNSPTEELMDVALLSKTGIRYYDIEFKLEEKK